MKLKEFRAYKRLSISPVAAEGNELVLADGRRVLDLYGGHCVNTLGAGDEDLGETIQRQWRRLSFATNLLDHAARLDFMHAFAPNLPDGEWQFFCSNSGAEANENALKVALAATKRSKVIYFKGAFHGRTAAAAAVSDTKHVAFPAAPFTAIKLPWGDVAAARAAIDASVGAVILEPIQSLAGVVEPPHGFLETLRSACDAVGAALIFDEVQTGNGRLGEPWAAQHFGVVPDVFTTAKGAASGLPIGLTVLADELAARVDTSLLGSTFGGGPVVLAAAAETARRIAAPGFLERVRATSSALQRAAMRGPVESVRGAGLLLGLVLEQGQTAAVVRDQLLAHGVLVGTSDDPRVLRLSPALTLEPHQAARLEAALDALTVNA
ncbi:MAG: aminotransferase class III-fold pyridoxal phosphate-dependent enzyme [Planctomycetes bacterium]|nr:aminotransferase class III-fold pyridoxal phosphate-dependent enzyme [Planctomycetota bacterium]